MNSFKSRWFRVLDSSCLPFYSAPPPLCTNFDGKVLRYVGDNCATGQVVLAQPYNGVVSLDPEHVQEVEIPEELK